MNTCESKPYSQGDKTARYLHVVVVSHCQDDDEQHGCAQHLVHGQAQGTHLLCGKEWIGSKYSMCSTGVVSRDLHLDEGEDDAQVVGDICVLTILIASAYSPHTTRAARNAPRYCPAM